MVKCGVYMLKSDNGKLFDYFVSSLIQRGDSGKLQVNLKKFTIVSIIMLLGLSFQVSNLDFQGIFRKDFFLIGKKYFFFKLFNIWKSF